MRGLLVPMGMGASAPVLGHLGRAGEESLPEEKRARAGGAGGDDLHPAPPKAVAQRALGRVEGVFSPRLLTTTT
jgi:hypothetical protein